MSERYKAPEFTKLLWFFVEKQTFTMARSTSRRYRQRPRGTRQWRGLIHHVDLFCEALDQDELLAFAAATVPNR